MSVGHTDFDVFPTQLQLCFLLTVWCVSSSDFGVFPTHILVCFLLRFWSVSYSQSGLFPTHFLLTFFEQEATFSKTFPLAPREGQANMQMHICGHFRFFINYACIFSIFRGYCVNLLNQNYKLATLSGNISLILETVLEMLC